MSKLFAIIAHDVPNAKPTRMEKLKEHLASIEGNLHRLAVAGPMRDADGDFTGSLLIVKAEDEADARKLIESDPYFAAGVWSKVEVHAFGAVAGDWVGGRNW